MQTSKRTVKGTTVQVELQKGSISLEFRERVEDGSITDGQIFFSPSEGEKNNIGNFSSQTYKSTSGTGLPTTTLNFSIYGVGVEDHQASIISLINEARVTALANVPS